MPVATDTVVVHYHGTLIDGTVFDSSVDKASLLRILLTVSSKNDGSIRNDESGFKNGKYLFLLNWLMATGLQDQRSNPTQLLLSNWN